MARIAFIGAGSVSFTRNLLRDIFTFENTKDGTIVLMDIDKERLELAKKAVDILIERGQYPVKVETTMDRRKALKGADAVLIAIMVGSTQIWKHDLEIPAKYGVDFCVGDTRGVAGIFRALRTMPVMLDICRDIEKLCPDAIVLNYTNPMAMLTRAMQKETNLQITGLCHSVQFTSEMLARWIKAPINEITYLCAGINHQAWYLEFEWNGQDAYPLIRKAMKRKKIYNEEIVRNQMCMHLGYYVTESSGHASEYSWWFRKRPELIEKYCLPGTGWCSGESHYILKEYLKRDKGWKSERNKFLKETAEMSLARGREYASSIISARLGGDPFVFNGNMPNTGIIPNLPKDVCVEVPVLVNRRGFSPMYVGELPPQLAAINNLNIAIEEMAVEAALTGNPELVFHAVCYDPVSAAVLSLDEIKKMVKQMLKKNQPYLPQFKSIEL